MLPGSEIRWLYSRLRELRGSFRGPSYSRRVLREIWSPTLHLMAERRAPEIFDVIIADLSADLALVLTEKTSVRM